MGSDSLLRRESRPTGCLRFRNNLALFATREEQGLTQPEMEGHLQSCPGCRGELASFREQNALLREQGSAGSSGNPDLWSGLKSRLDGVRRRS